MDTQGQETSHLTSRFGTWDMSLYQSSGSQENLSKDLPNPGMEQADSLPLAPPGKYKEIYIHTYIYIYI